MQLLDGLIQPLSEAVPQDLLWEGPEALLADGQSVALWEEAVFAFSLVHHVIGVSNCLLRSSNLALLAVCGSQSDYPELLLVTPLAFSSSCSSGRDIAHTGRVLG